MPFPPPQLSARSVRGFVVELAGKPLANRPRRNILPEPKDRQSDGLSSRNRIRMIMADAGCTPAKSSTSELREVARQLALEFCNITGDHGDVEATQDRPLGFAIKQELERRFDAMLRRVRAHRQSFASVSRPRDVMVSLALSHADDDLEFEWVAFAGLLYADHSLPSP
jgi:hypothetical protein